MQIRFWLISFVAGIFPVATAHTNKTLDSHQHQSHSHGDISHHNHADDAITEAHVHGVVMLQLARQGEKLVVELTSPAMNFVGFEHRASTPEQIQVVQTAETKLSQVGKWLKLEGGDCRVTDFSADFTGVLQQADELEHANIDIDAQFTCAQPTQLRGMQVMLFQDFPGIEKMTVQWVSGTGAGEDVLTRDKSRVTFN